MSNDEQSEEQEMCNSIISDYDKEVARLRISVAVLEDEAEQLRVQLAACLVAAEGGTFTAMTAENGDYGWSCAYQKTLDLRRQYEELLRVSGCIV